LESTPFTLEEAIEICEDFEDLKDTEFTMATNVIYLVDEVVVCPFNEADKQLFIESFLTTKDSERSLNPYTGKEYDVMLFAYDADDYADRVYIDIRTFADKRGIGYSFPVHS